MRRRYPAPEIGIAITTFEKVEDEISRVFWCRLFAWARICHGSINHAALFCSGGRSSLTRITLNNFPEKFT